MKKSYVFPAVPLMLFAVLFFVLNFFTPLIHDDFAYLYKFGPKADVRPTAVPVRNVLDVFESQYYHYLDVNGRFFSHFLIQLILLMGKSIFDILNTLMFLGLIFFTYGYTVNLKSTHKNIYLLVFIMSCIWFLSPFIGQTMLWVTGSINYLWSSCLVVLFLFLFRREEQANVSRGYIKLSGLFIFSFLIAGTNESVTFGVAAALAVYAVPNFRKLSAALWVMIIGFGLGVLGIIFSPGTFNRVGNEVAIDPSFYSLLFKKLLSAIAIVYFLKFSILISLCLLVFLRIRRISILMILKSEGVLLMSILFNCLLLMLVENIEERMLFGTTVLWTIFNTILFLRCVQHMPSLKLIGMSVVLSCFLGFSFYHAIVQVNDYRNKNNVFENQMKNKSQKVFYFPPFDSSRFVYHTMGGVSDSKNYHNRIRSLYYGVPQVNILPQNLYLRIYNNSFFKNRNTVANETQLLLLKSDQITVIKILGLFEYTERILATIKFSNSDEKTLPVSVMPINNTYYGFIKTDMLNTETAVSVQLITPSGKIISKVEHLK